MAPPQDQTYPTCSSMRNIASDLVTTILGEAERCVEANRETLDGMVELSGKEVLAAGQSIEAIYKGIAQQLETLNNQLAKANEATERFRTSLEQVLRDIPAMVHWTACQIGMQAKGAERAKEQVGAILSFADAISNISLSSRLLSVNAQIEAVRAGGETGKAFAVVAQSIGDLNKEVKQAAEAIEQGSQAVENILRGLTRATQELIASETNRATQLLDVLRQCEELYKTSQDAAVAAFRDVRSIGELIRSRSNEAIMHLQYEDRARQAVAAVVERDQSFLRHLRELMEKLRQSEDDADGIRLLVEQVRSRRDPTQSAVGPSTQDDSGEITFL